MTTSPVKILLVADDNEDVIEALSWLLTARGHEVYTARDGIEAVEAVRQHRPEIALLDLGMPRLDGYGAARSIRAEPWGRDVKLIAQSGYGQEADKQRAKEAGFDLHLTKPVAIERLDEALAILMRTVDEASAVGRHEGGLASNAYWRSVRDRGDGRERESGARRLSRPRRAARAMSW